MSQFRKSHWTASILVMPVSSTFSWKTSKASSSMSIAVTVPAPMRAAPSPRTPGPHPASSTNFPSKASYWVWNGQKCIFRNCTFCIDISCIRFKNFLVSKSSHTNYANTLYNTRMLHFQLNQHKQKNSVCLLKLILHFHGINTCIVYKATAAICGGVSYCSSFILGSEKPFKSCKWLCRTFSFITADIFIYFTYCRIEVELVKSGSQRKNLGKQKIHKRWRLRAAVLLGGLCLLCLLQVVEGNPKSLQIPF